MPQTLKPPVIMLLDASVRLDYIAHAQLKISLQFSDTKMQTGNKA